MGCLYRRREDGRPVGNWLYKAGGKVRSTKTKERKLADRIARRWEAEENFPGEAIQVLTFAAILPAYREWSATAKKSSTVRGERAILKRLAARFGEDRLDRIAETDVQRFVVQRRQEGCKGGTVNRELSTLSSVLRFAVARRHLAAVPRIKRVSEADAGRRQPLPEGSFPAILQHLDPRARLAALIMFHTGLRVGSVVSMTWDQVDLARRMIRLPASNVKQGRSHDVYLSDELLAELETARGEGLVAPLHRDTLCHWFKAAMAKAGIDLPGSACHALRHLFVTDLLARGVDIATVRDLAGHSTVAVTERYAHATEERQRAAVAGRTAKAEGAEVVPIRRKG